MHSRSLLLACAGLVGATAAVSAAPAVRAPVAPSSVLVHANDDGNDRRHYRDGEGTVVDAPGAYVDTRGPVVVDAPAAHVEVDRGSVHVEAPFVNLRIPR
jgi:hypothetical protein